jgi:IS5 family transposase
MMQLKVRDTANVNRMTFIRTRREGRPHARQNPAAPKRQLGHPVRHAYERDGPALGSLCLDGGRETTFEGFKGYKKWSFRLKEPTKPK